MRAWGGVLAALAIASCTMPTREEPVTVVLAATPQNAGQIGRAFLVPRGAVTEVRIEVSGVPKLTTSRPVHLYTFLYDGPCDRLPAKPALALTERVLANSTRSAGATPAGGPFVVVNTAPLALEALRRANYAIVIRTSPADGDLAIFCGTAG